MAKTVRAWTLILYFLAIHASAALQWTSSRSLPDGITIPTCSGQDVTLSWNFTADPEEHLMNVEWHFTPAAPGSATVLATEVMGNFFAAPSATQKLQFVPNAGVRLQNVAAADSGTYTVHVNLNRHGSVVTEVQSVHVLVSDSPITNDGQLHVTMSPEAVYDTATQQFHVQLACGDFKPVWVPSVAVVWKTPSGTFLPSTSYDKGRFLLSVPNPVTSGEYNCTIAHTSPVNSCVRSGSPLQRGATQNVDGVDARFAVMEAKIKAVQTEKAQLEARHQQELSAMQQQIQNHMSTVLDLRLQQLENRMASLTTGSGLHTASVSFHADIINHRAINNDGLAFNPPSGIFTAPVSGTYLFLVSVAVDANGGTRHFQIVVDAAVTIAECYAKKLFSGGGQGSCHAIVKLRAGQTVQLDHVEYGNTDALYFSGALLRAD